MCTYVHVHTHTYTHSIILLPSKLQTSWFKKMGSIPHLSKRVCNVKISGKAWGRRVTDLGKIHSITQFCALSSSLAWTAQCTHFKKVVYSLTILELGFCLCSFWFVSPTLKNVTKFLSMSQSKWEFPLLQSERPQSHNFQECNRLKHKILHLRKTLSEFQHCSGYMCWNIPALPHTPRQRRRSTSVRGEWGRLVGTEQSWPLQGL